MSNKFGKLFLLIGPSGVGKGTFIEELKKSHLDWVFPVSVTTRKKRPHEKEGKTYYFYTKKKFEDAKNKGEFLEYACVHGEEFYGLLRKTVLDALEEGKVVFREIDIQGFETIKKTIHNNHLISIFLLPPNLKILEQRIRNRSPLADDEIERRIESAKKEIIKSKECNYKIQTVDGQIQKGVNEIEKIVEQEMEKSDKL